MGILNVTPDSFSDGGKWNGLEAALKAGADLVNDTWGLKYDRKVADLIARYQVPCVLMHNREKAE